MSSAIKFGTDGWRAVIADQYTFHNVERISRGTAAYLHKHFGASPKVVIGYDSRFGGAAFAARVAQVLASDNIHVLLTPSFVPTPAISWATRELGCNLGIVITASHNPPEYNGFKLKADFGGPATPEMNTEVEVETANLPADLSPLRNFDELKAAGKIEIRDIKAEYMTMLRQRLDIEAIRNSGVRIAHDAMYGAGQGIIAELLGGNQVVEVRCDFNPGMYGQPPEPIERNLQPLSDAVIAHGCAAGIANDGDADRVGMYDENGVFVDSHRLLALLVKYLGKTQGQAGDVVITFSTSSMLPKMCQAYGLKVHCTPIGFKYIGSLIVEGDVLVGGEESGGMAVKGHIPERDGIYIGLLIVEMMVKSGKTLSELVQELYREFGPHAYRRIDVHTTQENKEAIVEGLKVKTPETLAGLPVRKVETMDGYKLYTDHGWLLIRFSGTEPVLRLYAEAETLEDAEQYLEDIRSQLGV